MKSITVESLEKVKELGAKAAFEEYEKVPVSELSPEVVTLAADTGQLNSLADFNEERLIAISDRFDLKINIPSQEELDKIKDQGPFLVMDSE